MNMLKRIAAIGAAMFAIVIVVGVPALVGVRPFIGARARPLTNRTFEATPARLERGRYLVTGAHPPCILCHSPLEVSGGHLTVQDGMTLAGRNWTPDGVPFVTAPNLTPDVETGIGTWTDDQLARAIREGIGHDGRTLFPVMPYEKFRHMSDEDLASIIVYLRSLAPIRHPLPKSNVPFPVKYLINNVPEPIDSPVVPDLSTPEKRGAYLVTISVCADCHTTRDDQGNVRAGMDFAGGTTLVYGEHSRWSANITPGVNGIPYYTEALFIETMRTGRVHSRPLDDFMPTAFFKNFTDQDLKDIFAYLKTLKPVDHYVDNALPATYCPKCRLKHGGGDRNRQKNF